MIYIPPIEVIVTQPAIISFRSAHGMIYKPGDGVLNITQVLETEIVLYVRNNAMDALRSRDRGSFRCHHDAQDLTTLQVNSTGEFEFQDGGEFIDSLVFKS